MAGLGRFALILGGLLSVVAAQNGALTNDSLPVVDLGYAIHQASISISNQSNTYYNFSNIRYAAPPLGNLRFNATLPPLDNRTAGIQDGSYGNICPQAFASWQIGDLSLNPGASNENEDCLFLDVVVPENVYAQNKAVPVIVWIHGGGYTLGSKYAAGNPTGLLDQSLDAASGGQIWVGINYRLGAFGWLNGETFSKSGTPNVGLYDQRMALEWVQKNIHLFGGDASRVTAMGESAGGGSILHQVTAYGGRKAPFNQAIMQSPAFIPNPLKSQSDSAFRKFLTAANVSTLEEARMLDTSVLQLASKIAQGKAFYGTFTFGPMPDGDFVPDLPGKLLLDGKFDQNLTILAAHNSNEAGHYTPPTATYSDNFTTYIQLYFPAISPETLTYLAETLYPPIFDGSQPYTTPFDRLNLAISHFTFVCSTSWLGHAFNCAIYNYLFSVAPGNHTQDVPYTFFNGAIASVKNDTVAVMMQRYLAGFVENGDPNREGVPDWGTFGGDSRVMNFNQTFVDIEVDEQAVGERCGWWQKALYGDDF
ncbi:Carboxylesterase patB [Lachnellula suecica]|uniref:Carboxylesterase patB n=1 Tax=Lachnellula suecica TaxID=602035 RepID=A0A8T9CLZ5_9HELO|nr:Carboxylesterase patB [Lachnellula suecica]